MRIGKIYSLIIPVFFFSPEVHSSNVIQDRICLANVTLSAHVGVDSFYYAEVTGTLTISVADITDVITSARVRAGGIDPATCTVPVVYPHAGRAMQGLIHV